MNANMYAMWVVFAALTALVMAMVLFPLLRTRRGTTAAGPSESAFYRDQLAEIDRDVGRGLLSQADAESARVEAARRLLRASPDGVEPAPASAGKARLAALVVVVLTPLCAAGLYLRYGRPQMPDEPLAARLANPGNDIEAIVAKVERRLAERPDEGRGYDVLAPVYMKLGRIEKAENAFSEAIRLLGPSPDRLVGLAEARLTKAQGVVSDKVREPLEQALALDPQNPRAQYLLAVAAEQEQKPEKARAIYEKILAEAPQGAPWIGIVSERLAKVGGAPPSPGAPALAPGVPTGPAADAIAALPPEQRQAQIRGMVENLAARLSQNGQDVQGWLRLLRSWTMLGEKDKANAALAEARKALAADAPGLAQIDGLAKELGLGG
jgi:cytochrome c-type biogenesis protein CcmH